MNAKVEVQNSMFDRIKWICASTLLLAGIFANYYFHNQPATLRVAGWVVLVCMILAIIFQTAKGKKLW